MPLILAVLILLDTTGLTLSVWQGLTLSDAGSIRFHFLTGVLTTILIVFTHSLVIFYLIGTGMDIREAVSADSGLQRLFVPLTRRLKRSVFPAVCSAALLTIVAALMGAEVHSRLITAAGDLRADPPVRGVSVWWLHLGVVVFALLANGWAFARSFAAARANRAAIGEINRLLASYETASEALRPTAAESSPRTPSVDS